MVAEEGVRGGGGGAGATLFIICIFLEEESFYPIALI